MLRVGLTGSLGSGKSTAAGYLRELGAHVVEADELGRTLMEPGQPVYAGRGPAEVRQPLWAIMPETQQRVQRAMRGAGLLN